ncbi:MAG: M24 family metallopeptidase [Candidatus Freyarchaeota archaeon]
MAKKGEKKGEVTKKKWETMPYSEYKRRVQTARELLAKHNMDAMILFSPINWRYYGGWTDVAQMHNWVWRSCMIIPRDHNPVNVCHGAFYWQNLLTTYVEDNRFWSETEGGQLLASFLTGQRVPSEFWQLLLDTLKELKLDKGTIGIEKGPDIDTYLSFEEYDLLNKRLPDAKIVAADPVIWEQRSVKTSYEIEIIREGCKRSVKVLRAAFETIKPGVNELDVHRAFWRACAEQDLLESPNCSTWLCWSSNAEEEGGVFRWITGPVDRIIKEGDMGISDCGPTYKGYQMDWQRTFYVGNPPKKQIELSKLAIEGEQAAIDALVPGAKVGDAHKASVEALKKKDPMQVHIINFVGHGMGLSNHEPPWIIPDNPTVVKENMVFCVEVGAFDLEMRLVGAMPEDIVLVTKKGPEILTKDFPRDLWIAK